jgi:hypothetical protein
MDQCLPVFSEYIDVMFLSLDPILINFKYNNKMLPETFEVSFQNTLLHVISSYLKSLRHYFRLYITNAFQLEHVLWCLV